MPPLDETAFDTIARSRGLTIGPDTDRAYCATGEPVVTLTDAGVKAEGEGVTRNWECPTEDAAWAAYESQFRAYIADKWGVLYWRLRPCAERAPGGGWRICSRLLVSDRPTNGVSVLLKANVVDLYREMHRNPEMFKGLSLRPHLNAITRLILNNKSKSVLDYGCGKAELYTALALRQRWGIPIALYDPAVPAFDKKPTGMFDGVICTDVLEHVPEGEVGMTIDDILGYANQWVYLAVCVRPSRKTFPDGRNVHLTVRPDDWWTAKIAEAQLRLGRALTVEVKYTT